MSTEGWGRIGEEASVDLLRKALDLGINFFDTADSYGDGYGEEVLAKSLGKQRHDIVIATKVGYDFQTSRIGIAPGERPPNFSTKYIRYACEESFRRLHTDYIDLYQLHDPGMDVLEDDEVFDALGNMVREGKIRYYGVTLGPGLGRFEEGEAFIEERNVHALQLAYNMLDHEPARRLLPIAREEKTGLIVRAPHASGLLDGAYTRNTLLGPSIEMSDKQREWLQNGLQKLRELDFLSENTDSTIGQIAIKFALAQPSVTTVLPNIASVSRLEEFALAPDTDDIPEELLDHLDELYDEGFYLGPVAEASAAE